MSRSAILLTLLFLPLLSTTAQTLECVSVKAAQDDTIAYRLRENDSRCEGFYRSNIGNPSLEVVSLLYTPLSYNLRKDKSLQLSAPHIKNQTVHLKVQGIPLKLYYRLDAKIPVGKTFNWPLDILAQEKIHARNLGVLGQLENEVFVPLRINSAQSSESAQLSLRSSVDVTKAQWRYAEVKQENCSDWADWKDLQPRYGKLFRSGRAIHINLPKLQSQQICVEVAAQPRNGEWLKQLLRVQLNE